MCLWLKGRNPFKEANRLARPLVTTAVTEAVRERLERVRRERAVELTERLLLIGHDCRSWAIKATPMWRTFRSSCICVALISAFKRSGKLRYNPVNVFVA